MTVTLTELADFLGADAINRLRLHGMLDGNRPSLKAYAHGLAVKIPYGTRTEGRIAHTYYWFPDDVFQRTMR